MATPFPLQERRISFRKTSRSSTWLISALLMLSGGSLWGQETSTVDDYVVTATRIETPVLTSPGFVTVISGDSLAKYSSLPEALAAESDVRVNDYGPRGSLQTASIQGSSDTDVLVMVDGVRLNSSRDGTVDLSTIPIGSIDRVEILRGGGSSRYGTDAVGGIINIITKKPAKDSLDVRVQNGGYLPHSAVEVVPAPNGPTTAAVPAGPLSLVDTQELDAAGTKMFGQSGVRVGVSATRAANQFTWLDTPGLGEWRALQNGGAYLFSGFGDVHVPLWAGGIDVHGEGGWSSLQVYGPISETLSLASPSDATQEETSASSTATLTEPTLAGMPISSTVDAFYRYNRLHYVAPSFSEDDTHTTSTTGTDFTQHASLSDDFSLTWDGAAAYDVVSSTTIGDKERLNLGGGVSASYSLDALTLTPAIRYDYFDDAPGAFSYSLDGVWEIAQAQALKLSLSNAYRVPTLNELYWPSSDPYTQGNPQLKPETAYSGQLGYTLREREFRADAYLLSRYTVDAILWPYDPTIPPAGKYRAVNLGRTFVAGADVDVEVPVAKWLRLSGGYVFLYSFLLEDETRAYAFADNVRVPYVPMHSFKGSATATVGRNTVVLSADVTSQEFTDSANTPSFAVPLSIMLNLEYRLQLSDHVSIEATAKNLLNQVYATLPGYLIPPFSVWAGATLAF